MGNFFNCLMEGNVSFYCFNLAPGGGKKILGGCATVAGWGNRYSTEDMHDNQAQCMTDYSNLSPDKIG